MAAQHLPRDLLSCGQALVRRTGSKEEEEERYASVACLDMQNFNRPKPVEMYLLQ